MSALSDPNSLCVPLSSSLIPNISDFSTLINSGSTHCFVDTEFVNFHNLPIYPISPIELKSFDSTSNSIITRSLELPVLFPTSDSMTINFYVTLLNPSCSVVLGYNWLTHYNPMIDWVLGRITFRLQLLDLSFPSLTLSARAAKLLPQNPSTSDEAPKPSDSALHISLIGAAVFMCACKLPGTQSFRIHLSDTSLSAKSASISDEAPNLSLIPEEYHDYADVFDKANSMQLAPHRPYNLKINLEEGASPPIVPMYSLSQVELKTLREFIDEHL